jgi:hypothetical protein
MTWKCLHCREVLDDDHDVCWCCGADRDGAIDPDFQHADDYEPTLPPSEKPQFHLRTLLWMVTALSLIFGMLSVIAAGRLTVWSAIVFVAGLVSLMMLIGMVFASLLAAGVRRIGRDIRAAIHRDELRRD